MFPTKPTYATAQEAYQTLLELARAHPEDRRLPAEVDCAWRLLVDLWTERNAGAVPSRVV